MHDSSLGGPLLWPLNEPWPVQPGSHFGPYDETPVPAVPLLQLYQRDVAQLPFPEGASAHAGRLGMGRGGLEALAPERR